METANVTNLHKCF